MEAGPVADGRGRRATRQQGVALDLFFSIFSPDNLSHIFSVLLSKCSMKSPSSVLGLWASFGLDRLWFLTPQRPLLGF